MRIRTLCVGCLLGTVAASSVEAAGRKPVAAKKPSMLRTYRFTAKIIHNGGISSFKKGAKLTGRFTYDLSAPNQSKMNWNGLYRSTRNTIEIRYGKLKFRSTMVGSVSVLLRPRNRSEGFSLSGIKLKMPTGWRSHRQQHTDNDRSSISLTLYNKPGRRIIRNTRIPAKLDSWKRFEKRLVVLYFADGVSFPEGRRDKPTSTYAEIEMLQSPR